MPKYSPENIRNIVLCGHGGSGKTTLTDAFLNASGKVKRLASVDDGTSICDFDEEEKAHKYTIEPSCVNFDWAGKHFDVFDSPGYPDFIGGAISTMGASDTAVIVVNATSGIEVNTRRVFAEAKKAGLGRMVVLSKMDGDNIKFDELIESIKAVFGQEAALFNVPIGQGSKFTGVVDVLKPIDAEGALVDPNELHEALIETIVSVDDSAMERYFEGELPNDEEMAKLIAKGIKEESLIPIFCVSAKTGVGLNELLNGLASFALPSDAIVRTGKDAEGADVEVAANPDGPIVAQVFKTRIDPFVQKINYIRVFSGVLKTGANVPLIGSRKGFKIAQLFEVVANDLQPIDEAGPGMIVAVTKTDELKTCATLGDVEMPRFLYPTPMVGLAASPKNRGDEAKVSVALTKLAEEDLTFKVERNEQTKQMLITGMSELHLQVLQERLKRRDKVELETKEQKIPYRETIQQMAEGSYRHKKQSGGAGQFGEVHIRMFPFPGGTDPEEFATDKNRFPSMKEWKYFPENNFLWIDSIVGGTIPSNFMPAIDKGFKDRMESGVIAGYQVQDLCIEVYFGKYHPVDSNEQAFRTAAKGAFKETFMKARPALLEPIVNLDVTVPVDKVGDVNSDVVAARRGRPLGVEDAGGGYQTVKAEVPFAEVTTYSRALASMTGGQGSYTIEFNRYDIVPGNIQSEIIAKAELKEDEE
ncbi:MAG: elongation factor G [Thermoguttaceae bacterium]|nr:elongation factor G [Thermoguttaceae bacterium]MBR5759084.1 elongation factor G [Thermoguttaceae bacterium]